jgi:tetratricopeptide (TPR) repeat protein
MYLPLAAVLALVVVGVDFFYSRLSWGPGTRRAAVLALWLPAIAVLGVLSVRRIDVYHTPLGLWRETVEKSPNSMLARNFYSWALFDAGRVDEAMEQSLQSLRAAPDQNPRAHQNLGSLLVVKGRPAEAIPHLEESVRLQPDNAKAHFVLGRALSAVGRSREAAEHYRRSFELEPEDEEACGALAMSLARSGESQDGIGQMEDCVRRWPRDPRLRNNLASLLVVANRHPEALAELEEAVRLDPGYALGRFNLAQALLRAGRRDEGAEELARAYRDAGADEGLRKRIRAAAQADPRLSARIEGP